MTEKELKKLTRYQLLELLIAQTERAEKLEKRVKNLEEQLNEQNLEISSLGSIAEASLQLWGVFQSAQSAADAYLDAAKKRAKEIEQAANKKAEKIISAANSGEDGN